MHVQDIITELKERKGIRIIGFQERYGDELYILVERDDFRASCIAVHQFLGSAVVTLFAEDQRASARIFIVYCAFMASPCGRWVFVCMHLPGDDPVYDSIAKDIYSASLFEREMQEMFGILARGNPDQRRLRLHEEVWPAGAFPLRKDFQCPGKMADGTQGYVFTKGQGKGMFEVPVGPVHAGIIGPGHFRFSVAGEPIINLEIRLGYTHRGAEKLFEGLSVERKDAVLLSECIAGDGAFSHSLAWCRAVEKIIGYRIPERIEVLRVFFLELERLHNHMTAIGGIAVDVGFSFPAAMAALIKESLVQLNEKLTGSRYLKGLNAVGSILRDIDEENERLVAQSLASIERDFGALVDILHTSVSFLDRVDGTGVVHRKTALDLGVMGLIGRAAGNAVDVRADFSPVYRSLGFKPVVLETGDVRARLEARILECHESIRLLRSCMDQLSRLEVEFLPTPSMKEGSALGVVEGARGPVFYWVKINSQGLIERCKITDPSFQNWQGLSFAVLGDIVPDFPVCNKSFDLSYAGNDL